MDTFAERLTRLRCERGYSKLGLANAADVTEAAIRRLENGINKSPSYAVGLRLADVLGVDPYTLGGVERRR
jgi:transcriptional regulator with XRE-family HTH domain